MLKSTDFHNVISVMIEKDDYTSDLLYITNQDKLYIDELRAIEYLCTFVCLIYRFTVLFN